MVDMMRRFELYDALFYAEQRLSRAVMQITALQKRRSALNVRFTTVQEDEDECIRLLAGHRLMIVDGVLDMYFRYCRRKRREILKLRAEIAGGTPEVENSDGESDMATDDEEDGD